jgi:hypothetical protein
MTMAASKSAITAIRIQMRLSAESRIRKPYANRLAGLKRATRDAFALYAAAGRSLNAKRRVSHTSGAYSANWLAARPT